MNKKIKSKVTDNRIAVKLAKWLSFFLLFYFVLIGISVSHAQQRIISLTPATTEILFALGLDEAIIGVTSFCNYPPEAKNKEKIGTFSQPAIEKIISLKPDIIFATGLEQVPAVDKLKQLGLNVCVSDPQNLDELYSSISEIGELTGRKKQALNIVNNMKKEVSAVKSKVKNIAKDDRPKVFIEIWHDPLMTAGKGSFIDQLITISGGENIAFDTPRQYCYFSPEQVIKRNPDCIILGYMDKKNNNDVSKRLGWKNISAVRNNRVYKDINPDIILRPGPRLAEGLKEIYKRLYLE